MADGEDEERPGVLCDAAARLLAEGHPAAEHGEVDGEALAADRDVAASVRRSSRTRIGS